MGQGGVTMRWLLRVAGSLALLAVLAVAALFLVPTEKVANLAAGEFRKITGRTLHFDGAVRPTIWPHLGARTGSVTLANAEWSKEGPMLTADGLSISVDLAALFGGAVRVTGIELVNPRLVLERAEDGRVNWDLTAPAAAEAAPQAGAADDGAPAAPLAIDRATIEGGTVVWIDHRAGTQTSLTDLSLDASIPQFRGEATLSASATVGGQAASLDATIDGFAAFLEGQVVPVALTGRAGKNDLAFDGRAGLSPLAAEGEAEATLGDVPALLALVGESAPDLPEGLGKRSAAVAGAVTLTPEGSAHLREGIVSLDGNRFQGDFDLVPGKARPRLTAKLTTDALNLTALGGGSGGSGGNDPAPSSGGSGGGWSTTPIDASGLGALDAAIALAAESVDLGGVKLGRTRASLTIDAVRAVIDLTEVVAYGGAVTGQIIVNARKGLSSRVNLTLAGLALEPLLSQLAGYDRLTGTGDLRFNLLGSGSTMAALMSSLEGEGNLAFRQGEVRGLDLAGMIRTLDAGFVGEGSKTVFDSVTGSFTVVGGVLSNGDLAIAAPLVTAQGAGTVDIGGRNLDYRLTPLSLGGRALDPDVQVPVLISGPWAQPSVRLDLETLARRKFEEEAKELEERARAELAQKAQEELGIEMQEGESLEDLARRAAQQALEQEAARALERILGGGSGE
jgi:AsmA protein